MDRHAEAVIELHGVDPWNAVERQFLDLLCGFEIRAGFCAGDHDFRRSDATGIDSGSENHLLSLHEADGMSRRRHPTGISSLFDIIVISRLCQNHGIRMDVFEFNTPDDWTFVIGIQR